MKVRRLTPAILKRIIAEEKSKLKVAKEIKTKKKLVETKAEKLTKLALLLEAREKLKLKKIKKLKSLIKKSLS